MFEWTFNKTNIDKLSALSEIVAKYNRDVNKIRKYTDDYLATINEFMHDSGKKIAFNNNGDLRFILEDKEEDEGHINSLSSGEIQLVVSACQKIDIYLNLKNK